MNASSNSGNALAQSIPVYRAEEFLVIDGANIDDTLSFAAEVMLDQSQLMGGMQGLAIQQKPLQVRSKTIQYP